MKEFNDYVAKNGIDTREKVINLIKENPDDFSIEDLSTVAEIVNNKRTETAAYYTDKALLSHMKKNLPDIEKDTIRILEPSVGIGNFLEILKEKYYNKKVIIDLIDIDLKSLQILKALNNYRDIPKNFTLNYINVDYLEYKNKYTYDLIIGNPPFYNMTKKQGLSRYQNRFNDKHNKNIAGFFLNKALKEAEHVFFVMPKYMLHNDSYKQLRKELSRISIETIIDFGEKGFKGVLIETISLLISTKNIPANTTVLSLTMDLELKQKQKMITDPQFPSWIIYRNDFFDFVASKLEFDVFTVYRDRQITNRILSNKGEIRVLRSRNIKRDGSGTVEVAEYDRFVYQEDVENLQIFRYLNRNDVYLCPNMTYYPRVIRKPQNVLVNGSIAIFEIKNYNIPNDEQLKYFASEEFEEFYRIARNHSTRSLNLDKVSVFYFGLLI